MIPARITARYDPDGVGLTGEKTGGGDRCGLTTGYGAFIPSG